jgi:hypothetical protein
LEFLCNHLELSSFEIIPYVVSSFILTVAAGLLLNSSKAIQLSHVFLHTDHPYYVFLTNEFRIRTQVSTCLSETVQLKQFATALGYIVK